MTLIDEARKIVRTFEQVDEPDRFQEYRFAKALVAADEIIERVHVSGVFTDSGPFETMRAAYLLTLKE